MSVILGTTAITFNDSTTQSTGTSGNFAFNSGYGSAATVYGCRAWVNFNGTGANGPATIRGSGNVTSVTKASTGDYTINFTNAMPDANYSAVCSGDASGSQGLWYYIRAVNLATGTCRLYCATAQGGAADNSIVCVSIFR